MTLRAVNVASQTLFAASRQRSCCVLLWWHARRRKTHADEIMAEIVAKRLVEHFERAGFVVIKRPPEIDGALLGRGFERK